MAEAMSHATRDYAARLVDAIGARPAGTEEEQQASFFIEEVLRDEAELPTEVEEFNCNLNYELPRTVCCVATAVLGILSIFLPLMVVPSVVITLITAALFITDALDRSLFTRFGNSGISQNVIARYTPQADPGMRGRKRKVVLISHYDTGKVRVEAKGAMLGMLPYLYIAELVGMALVPIALFIRLITSATGPLLTVMNVLIIIGVVVALLPVLGFLIHQTAQYNKGANVNAAGIAVLLACAKRVREDPDDLMGDILMSGEEQLREQGLVPEGAELSYEDEELPDGQDAARVDFAASIPSIEVGEGSGAQGSEAAAGAIEAAAGAVAAIPNVPAAEAAAVPAAVSETLEFPEAAAPDSRAAYTAAVSQNLPEPEPEEDPNVPEWYRKAMKKAKHEDENSPVHRSKFADALDNANAVSAAAAESAEPEPMQSEVERRLAQMRASIMGEAGAPGVATAAAEATTATHARAGVDGYLSSATETSSYEEAVSGAIPDLSGASQPAVAMPVTTPTPAANIPAPEDEVRAAAEAAAAAAAKAAAIADKTLSFIPVEVDTEAILRENAALKTAPEGGAPSAAASAPTKATVSAATANAHERKRRSINLPSLTGAIEGVNARLQEAPLGEAEAEASPSEEARNARRQARQEKLVSSLPSTDAQDAPDDDKTQAINVAGSFVSSSATTTFDPLGDEFVAEVDEDEIYVDDADDSDYASEFTASGAPAGAGYVEMPKSRASRMFGRFRRKKKQDEVSMSEAYGLDDAWDARSAGAKRGGWESFREDEADGFDAYDDDDWNGGAFSKVRELANRANHVPEVDEVLDEEGMEEEAAGRGVRGHRGERGARGGHSGRGSRGSRSHESDEAEGGRSRRSRRTGSPFGDLPLTPSIQLEERELIQQFRNGAISCEVWFLAVGAELANNAGIRAFLKAHADELKGAVIIDLDGLGAGHLSLIEEDGTIMVRKPNARLKRYVSKASTALGLNVGRGKMRWRNSGAYCTASHGLQTLHLAGMRDGKPAYGAQADDILDHVSEETLDQNTAFVMEILRQV